MVIYNDRIISQTSLPNLQLDDKKSEEGLETSNTELIELTEQFINEIGTASVSLEELIEDLPTIPEVQQVTTEIDQQTKEAMGEVGEKLDLLLANSSMASDQEKMNQALQLIQESYGEIKGKLESQQEKAESGEAVAEHLKIPLNAVIIGTYFAEKIAAHVDSSTVLTAFGSLADPAGVGLVGLGMIGVGMQCYAIQAQAKAISAYGEKIQSISERIKNETNPVLIDELELDLRIIENNVANLNAELKTKIIGTTHEFFMEAFEQTSTLIDFTTSSTSLFASHADMLTKLMTVSSGISVAGAIVSLGWTSYQVYQQAHEFTDTNKKIAQLTESQQRMGADKVSLAYINQSKIDRLKGLNSERKLQIGLQILNLSASSLALTAAFKGVLLASGVVLSATASAALTGTGVAGLVLLGGTVAVGTGVVVYRNRYNIEYAVKALPIMTQKIILKHKLKKANDICQLAEQRIGALTTSIREIATQKSQLVTLPEKIESVKEQKNPQTRWTELLKKEEMLLNDLVSASDQLNSTINSTHKIFRDIEILTNKKTEIDLNRRVKNLKKGFKTYDLTSLNVVKKVIEEALTDPQKHDQIRTHLRKECFEVGVQVNWDDVLNYILEPA